MNQLKFFYNRSFKDSASHYINTCFPVIACNDSRNGANRLPVKIRIHVGMKTHLSESTRLQHF